MEQSLLKHFGDIKDQTASYLFQKLDAAVSLAEIEVNQHSFYISNVFYNTKRSPSLDPKIIYIKGIDKYY
ncbi:hypothetical protein QUA41_05645 [Microcoleus sp. Pol11C1]|uniref:hypothetical protein n=1 Tax=unclassified Microcoleus TaxID=2642155 RepID=UPI002FD4FC59